MSKAEVIIMNIVNIKETNFIYIFLCICLKNVGKRLKKVITLLCVCLPLPELTDRQRKRQTDRQTDRQIDRQAAYFIWRKDNKGIYLRIRSTLIYF